MYNLPPTTMLAWNGSIVGSPSVRCTTSTWRCRLRGRKRRVIIELSTSNRYLDKGATIVDALQQHNDIRMANALLST
jgi:hypothetical protein